VKRDGGKPALFIVDSLIEGYSIGANAPRITADALMKLAAQGGYGLVQCEEQINDAPSPWVFAADTAGRPPLRCWRIAPGWRWESSEDRLASDDNDLIVSRDRRTGTDHVLELCAVQRGTLRQSAQRVRESITPANGVTWRRAAMCSVGSRNLTQISAGGRARSSDHAAIHFGCTDPEAVQPATTARARSMMDGS